ncbi:MAG: MurR/RpiR family transcriptional regulator [Rhodobacteraceae bacterium]|nr:MurR/RpiR family transcriptional regulator [Paracoccaceae bacterium]
MNDIFSRISAEYSGLGRADKKIADLILTDVDQVLQNSISGLAELAGVSPSSITRFSRQFSAGGFKDLKLLIAQAKSAQSPHLHKSVQALTEGEISGGQLEALYLKQIVGALNSTFGRLRAEALADAISAIKAAQRISVSGVAVSGLIAREMAMRLVRLGLSGSYISDDHFRRIAASFLGPDDVAICISHSGRSREVLEVGDIARGAGARVIGLTAPHTPLAHMSDIVLEISIYEEIDIYTPSISQFAYHYIIGLIVFHIGQSSDLDRDELLAKIKFGLSGGQGVSSSQ